MPDCYQCRGCEDVYDASSFDHPGKSLFCITCLEYYEESLVQEWLERFPSKLTRSLLWEKFLVEKFEHQCINKNS